MNESPESQEPKPLVKKVAVSFVGLLSLAWIFVPDPTDVVPVLGWLDEAAAAGIFLACLNYLGVPVGKLKALFDKGEQAQTNQEATGEKTVKGKVVEN